MQDILIRLQNQPKINGAHPKDITDAIKTIKLMRLQQAWEEEKRIQHYLERTNLELRILELENELSLLN